MARLNQIVCALRFFYGVTLGRTDIPELIPYAREPHKLPVVPSADEVVRFLHAVSGLKSRAALATAYAAGLRAAEVASLRVADIGSARGVIHVRHGNPTSLSVPMCYAFVRPIPQRLAAHSHSAQYNAASLQCSCVQQAQLTHAR